MLFYPPAPHASIAYARKLEAKVLVVDWHVGYFLELLPNVRNKAYAWLFFYFN
jgi:hypothetical protein